MKSFYMPIAISNADIDDFICITDMAAAKSENSRSADVVRNWLRTRSTLEFLSTWDVPSYEENQMRGIYKFYVA